MHPVFSTSGEVLPRGVRNRRVLAVLLTCVLAYSLVVVGLGRALDEASILLALRMQGRLSYALFIVALGALGAHALMRGAATTWLAFHRDALYVGCCVSHLIHGVWIVVYFASTNDRLGGNASDVSGAVAFPVVALLLCAKTSAGRLVMARAHAWVERSCVGYLWLQFVGFFLDRLGTPERRALAPWYLTAIVLGLVAGALSVYGAHRRHASTERADRRSARPRPSPN